MTWRPAHLTDEHAARFRARSVVDRYHLRLPYPRQTFETLLSLVPAEPMTVLDVGTGTGDIARVLVDRVERVDAVDASPAMLARARTLPNGRHSGIRWIEGRLEEVDLSPPYGLIVAADSLHWMNWECAFQRFAAALSNDGVVAVVEREETDVPWQEGLLDIIKRHASMYGYEPFDLVCLLEERGLFRAIGHLRTGPTESLQPVDEYVESFHSRAGLARDALSSAAVAAFDEVVRHLVQPWLEDGRLRLQTVGRVTWGQPRRAPAADQ